MSYPPGSVDVDRYGFRNGRMVKEDGSVVNEADGINADGSRNVRLAGSSMELYGKSTDTKPTENISIGTTFFEIDTKTVYMWDGDTWVVI